MRAMTMGGLMAVVMAFSAAAMAQPDELGPATTPRKAPPTPAPTPVRPEGGMPAKTAGAGDGWSIVLVACRGDGQEGEAANALAAARGAGVSDAYVEKRGAATVVAVGRFKERASGDAQTRLNEVRAVSVEGKKPYAGAILAPPSGAADMGGHPEWNLLKAKEEYGAKAKYTLQVAAYGKVDKEAMTEAELAEAHRAAEEAVAVLRREGELAYYYHSPTGKKLSMVCIGVWSDEDLAKKGDRRNEVPARAENAELTALKDRFPLNLVNGQKFMVKTRSELGGFVKTAQASSLVMIP